MIRYDLFLSTTISLTPVAVVQNTFTHKQYTEQHNETEGIEWTIHNNKYTETKQKKYITYKSKHIHTKHTIIEAYKA